MAKADAPWCTGLCSVPSKLLPTNSTEASFALHSVLKPVELRT